MSRTSMEFPGLFVLSIVIALCTIPAVCHAIDIISPAPVDIDRSLSTDGLLSVTSTPPGALIYIDGAGGHFYRWTPNSIYLQPGFYTVGCWMDGYIAYSKFITITSKETTTLEFPLKRRSLDRCEGDYPPLYFTSTPRTGPAPLTVMTTVEPPGLPISAYRWDMDGDRLHETITKPLELIMYVYEKPGEYTVSLDVESSDPCYNGRGISKTNYITVTEPEPFRGMNVDLLDNSGMLSVNSTPSGAEILIDGMYTNQASSGTPATILLQPGQYRLDVIKQGFAVYEKTVDIVARKTTSVDVKLIDLQSTCPKSPPSADFSATPTSGVAPLKVRFTAAEPPIGDIAYSWDVDGDGIPDCGGAILGGGILGGSVGDRCEYTFLYPGTYSVKLDIFRDPARGECDNKRNSQVKTNYITVTGPAPADGAVNIQSSPSAAWIAIDGVPVAGKVTPYTETGLTPGNHKIGLGLEGYEDYSNSFSITAGKVTTIDAYLKPIGGGLVSEIWESPVRIAADLSGTGDGPGTSVAGVRNSLLCERSGGTDCDGKCVNMLSDHGNCGSCGYICKGSELCIDGVCVFDTTAGQRWPQGTSGDQQGGFWASLANLPSALLQVFLPSGSGSETSPGGQLSQEAGAISLPPTSVTSANNFLPKETTPVPVFTPVIGAAGVKEAAEAAVFLPEGTITPAGAGCVSVSGQIRPELNPAARPVIENRCPYTICSGVCTDTAGDSANCGSCGNACRSPASCRNGICVVSTVSQPQTTRTVSPPVVNCDLMGKTSCNGRCADLQTDMGNCGSCGRACPTGYICDAGKCCSFMINPLTHATTKVCEQ